MVGVFPTIGARLTAAGKLARRAVARAGVGGARLALRRHLAVRPAATAGGDGRRTVTILLGSAWGMGGTIRAALNLAGYLARDHRVVILSIMRRRDVPFFDFPPGVEVIALDDERPGATPWWLRPVRDALGRGPSVLMRRAWRPFRACSLWTDMRLARELRRRDGVLIGTHPCLNLALAALAPPGFRTVGQEHMHLHAHHASVEQAIAALYPRLDALVVLTRQDAQEYAAAVTHPVRVVVIPNTVRPLGGARPTLSEPAVIAAGRLTPQKGFDMLIRAFAQVAAERADWELRICGAGRERGTLEALIHEMRLGDHVTLRGPVKRLGEEMSRASIFVLSSRFEGFPLVLVEAMSTGLPVVSFDCPTGPRDVIDHRGNGILVPPGDVDALARAMLELIADEDLRRRMGAAAARTATAYTIDAIGPRWSQLLDSLPPPSNVPASTAGRSANGGLDPVTAAPAAVRRPGAGA